MRRTKGSSDGAAAVEFALLLPLLVILVFGIISFSQAYNRSQGMNAAVREGARLASIGEADVDTIANAVAVALNGSGFGADVAIPAEIAARRADLDIDVVTYATVGDAAALTGGTSVTGATVPCDAANVVRVDGAVADPTQYGITIPFFSPIDMPLSAFAIFRCEP